MSALTSIEWTDRTWNPVRGCSRVSEGCRNCYAERMAARFSLDGVSGPGPFHGFAHMTAAGPRWTGKVELIPSKLDEPLRWKKPQRVFVNSMSDLFHEALPADAIDVVFAVMALVPRHTFQILTKRPARMRDYFAAEPQHRWIAALNAWAKWPAMPGSKSMADFLSEYVRVNGWPALNPEIGGDPLDHIWLGVSVEDQATADERIPLLLQTPAAVRFVSYEPALGAVDFARFLGGRTGAGSEPLSADGKQRAGNRRVGGEPSGEPEPNAGPHSTIDAAAAAQDRRLDWIIVGGESGPGARPFDVEWARSTVRQCKAAGVPVFVKQLGARVRVSGDAEDALRDQLGRHRMKRMRECDGDWRVVLRDRKGGDPAEWPEDLRVREFPEAR